MTPEGHRPVQQPGQLTQLTRYLLENRGRFTRESLTAKLHEAGYSEASIEAAWAVVEAGDEPARSPIRWLAMLIVVVAYVTTFIVFAMNFSVPWVSTIPVLGVSLLIGAGISILFIQRFRLRGSEAVAIVLFLLVPAVILAGIAGLCVSFGPFE